MSEESTKYQPPFWTILAGPVVYFGIKYAVFRGEMEWQNNLMLLLGSVLLIVALRQYYQRRQS